VVFAGSSSVYGDQPILPKTEEMPTNPLSPYALQKLMSEQYGQMFTRLYGLETVTTRYFNVFGPRQDPGSPYSGVISLFIKSLAEGSRPVIYGDGSQTRDFTFVTNVVDGVIRAAETPGVGGQVFNVATSSRVSLTELLAALKKIFGSTVEPIFKEARAGDVHDSQADIGKAERLLGYRPMVGLEEGLRQTVDWYRHC
jgi:UDP-glucose 4-epimerase